MEAHEVLLLQHALLAGGKGRRRGQSLAGVNLGERGQAAGAAAAILRRAWSANLYSYVLNNPATAFDPDRHKCCMR